MSVSNHGHSNEDHSRRFIEEVFGVAKRQFPNGRIGAEDDGAMSYAVAADPKHGIVKIVFSKPTMWLGLDVASIDQLIDCLNEKKMVIRGLAPNTEPSRD